MEGIKVEENILLYRLVVSAGSFPRWPRSAVIGCRLTHAPVQTPHTKSSHYLEGFLVGTIACISNKAPPKVKPKHFKVVGRYAWNWQACGWELVILAPLVKWNHQHEIAAVFISRLFLYNGRKWRCPSFFMSVVAGSSRTEEDFLIIISLVVIVIVLRRQEKNRGTKAANWILLSPASLFDLFKFKYLWRIDKSFSCSSHRDSGAASSIVVKGKY